jgi:cell division transport system permease protein
MTLFLKRIIKSGWKIFLKDKEAALANVFVLVLTLFLFSSLFICQEIGKFIISSLKEKADVSVYFKDTTSEDEILKIKDEVSKNSLVDKVDYVSKEEALQKFTARHQENPTLMAALKEVGNPFLPSLDIKVKDISRYDEILNFFKISPQKEKVEKIDYYQRKSIIDKIFFISRTLEKWGIALSLILIFTFFLISFNTIRLSISDFKEEITIQRLVGASNWFIRGPFIVQSIILVIFSTLISCFLLFSTVWFLSPKVESLILGLNLFSILLKNFPLLFLAQILIGLVLGLISTLLAVRRYLMI